MVAQTNLPVSKMAWIYPAYVTICLNFDLNSGVSKKKVLAFYRYGRICYLDWHQTNAAAATRDWSKFIITMPQSFT